MDPNLSCVLVGSFVREMCKSEQASSGTPRAVDLWNIRDDGIRICNTEEQHCEDCKDVLRAVGVGRNECGAVPEY